MLRNYFTIAYRNLLRHKAFSVINIAGLALGIAACLLIVLYLKDELSYDRFNEHYPQIYRVAQEQNQAGTWYLVGRTPAPLAASLRSEYPQIANATRFALRGSTLLKYGDKVMDEPGGMYAEPALFDMFSFPFAESTPQGALEHPHSIVLTESFARKYFGEHNPIGQVMQINNTDNLVVTGIIRDIPRNSHLQFDFVIPFEFLQEKGTDLDQWGAHAFYTYIQLREDARPEQVDAQLRTYVKEKFDYDGSVLYLQALGDIHLRSRFDFNTDFGQRGDIRYIYFFSGLALIILLIACFNFMNLSTAQAMKRAKEIGLRKVVGANRFQLIRQYLSESILLALIAGILALSLLQLALPFFNQLTGKQLSLWQTGPGFIPLFGLIVGVTGIVAGSYPAFFLSAFLPANVLKGQVIPRSKGDWMRRLLVTGQFTLSVMMLIATVAIFQQLTYIQQKKLGLNKDNLMYIHMKGNLKANYDLAKTELVQHPQIHSVAATHFYSMPFKWVGSSSGKEMLQYPGKVPDDIFLMHDFKVAHGFEQTMGLELIEGRMFSADIATDTANFILNEAAVKRMGLTSPVGTPVKFQDQSGIVIGVVKDFHYNSLHTDIAPALIRIRPSEVDYLLVRIPAGRVEQSIATVEAIAGKYGPDYPFEYHFFDEAYEQLYRSEQILSRLFNYFAAFAIFVSALGLFGLALFTTARRTKEIGIRKVLGASIPNVMLLLNQDFLKLVLIANLIAWPLAWWGIHTWLQNFAYRISLNLWFFVLPGLLVILIALLTVSLQTLKAARANPVNSLRNE